MTLSATAARQSRLKLLQEAVRHIGDHGPARDHALLHRIAPHLHDVPSLDVDQWAVQRHVGAGHQDALDNDGFATRGRRVLSIAGHDVDLAPKATIISHFANLPWRSPEDRGGIAAHRHLSDVPACIAKRAGSLRPVESGHAIVSKLSSFLRADFPSRANCRCQWRGLSIVGRGISRRCLDGGAPTKPPILALRVPRALPADARTSVGPEGSEAVTSFPNPRHAPLPGVVVAGGRLKRPASLPVPTHHPIRPLHSRSRYSAVGRDVRLSRVAIAPITTSPIFVHVSSSVAQTVQPPSKSRRASKVIICLSFERPEDGRRSFQHVEKTRVERRD